MIFQIFLHKRVNASCVAVKDRKGLSVRSTRAEDCLERSHLPAVVSLDALKMSVLLHCHYLAPVKTNQVVGFFIVSPIEILRRRPRQIRSCEFVKSTWSGDV